MPAPLLPLLAGLIGRAGVSSAAIRIGSVAASVGKSVRSATIMAGRAAAPVVQRAASGAMGAAASPAGAGAPAGARFSLGNMAKSIPGIGRFAPKMGAFTQRISQAVQTTLNLRPQSDQQPVSAAKMPGLSPGQMMSMMGSSRDQVQAAQSHEQEKQVQRAHADAAQERMEGLADQSAKLAGKLTLLGGAAIGAYHGMRRYAQAQMASLERLQPYGGGVAVAFQRLETQRIMQEIRRSQSVSASAQMLGKSLERLNAATDGFGSRMENVSNVMGTVAASLTATVAEFAEARLKDAEGLAEKAWNKLAPEWMKIGVQIHNAIVKAQGNQPGLAQRFLRRMADGDFAAGRQPLPPLREEKPKRLP
jgi:hypothetical protein